MQKTTAALTDTILGDSFTLDSILAPFDFGEAIFMESVTETNNQSIAKHSRLQVPKTPDIQRSRPHRLPWLGL
ncbi:hypothetical protein FF011L_48200 [Roseimaritima multifibrata]|uniref:Uncharacterized protein n=1 Tax=Roseimaritima multifibrata TaxID=1930274 RepID=A0A517MM99_9BACT|nr:hypothetical protein [Roseimaritima multifibrata]QDS96016.1 hypothetical protein FF011L_48200 [Roseimaritima multifibrata]